MPQGKTARIDRTFLLFTILLSNYKPPHEFGWTPGVGDGQGGLECCGPWGRKELDTTEQLN